MIGYTKPLYILPFDHKTSFISKMFGWKYETLTPEQKTIISDMRMMVFEGLQKAAEKGIAKENIAFLTDEEFGKDALVKAKEHGYTTMLTTEKSGQDMFTFDYGDDFPSHIENLHPTFTKALIRYNPGADKEVNKKQLAVLKKLSDYSHEHGYAFLLEPLIPATDEQLTSVDGDKARFDDEVRPALTVEMMREHQEAGVEPDVWKIEGFNHKEAYEKAITQARSGERTDVSIVILGRGGTQEEVAKWFEAGKEVAGVTGFAVGRTIFWQPLEQFHKGEISRSEAINRIGENFYTFYTIFTK